MSQPCSAVELVLFDARGLRDPAILAEIATVVDLGVMAGAVLDEAHVAEVIKSAGQSGQFGFWFGAVGNWPFERAVAFANVEPGRTLFVSRDPAARNAASEAGLQLYDERSGGIVAMIP